MRANSTFMERQAAWATLHYELTEMQKDALLFRANLDPKTHKPELHNPLLEATLVHARQLIEFLGGRRDKRGRVVCHPDDIVPDDFCPGWNPDALTGEAAEALKRLLADVPLLDQTLVHLSWDRARREDEDDKVGWDYLRIPNDVLIVWGAFMTHLDRYRSSVPDPNA